MSGSGENRSELEELARAVRELSARVQRLERRLDEGVRDDQNRPSRPSLQPAHTSLESRIGSQWLNRIGVVVVLFGVAYLLRLVYLRNWISATTWIWLGVGSGAGVIAASELFRRRGYRVLSLSLKAIGIGVIYLSLWAALEMYQVLSAPQAFAGLVIVTVAGAVLALREASEVLAALALVGGFLTPVLISMPAQADSLLLYIGILDCAAVALAVALHWWRLLPLAFAASVVLFTVSYIERYRPGDLIVTMVAITAYFILFCAASVWFDSRLSPPPRLLIVFEIAVPVLYFVAAYVLLASTADIGVAAIAFCEASLYFLLAYRWERRASLNAARQAAGYGGVGIALAAAALAVLLQSDWLSLGWFVEAAVVIAIGFWKDLPWLRWGALLLLSATIVKAFAFDVWQLSLGYRTLSFVALGVLLLIISFAYQRYGLAMMFKAGKGPSARPH